MLNNQYTSTCRTEEYTSDQEAALSRLPRLLYIGDVPVEPTVYGSALLYRLLLGYPKERLLILEGNLWRSSPIRRLPSVRYESLQIGISRLINSRLTCAYGSWLLKTAETKWKSIDRLLNGFKPDAVLTVTHGFTWLTASAFAEKYSLPLHLILHDEWVEDLRVANCLRPRMDKMFGHYYKTAVSRLCVSPYMADHYKKRYGMAGQILYPSRAQDAPCFDSPPSRLLGSRPNPVFAYGGTINFSGYPSVLRRVAEVLALVGGKLLIFGPTDRERAKAIGLDLPNIIYRGMVTSEKMIHSFREEADVLILPMSFESRDTSNMMISFPSKLTDYTASGVPILICGPHYCSAVRWARENPGVAAVVDVEDTSELTAVIKNLCNNPSLRCQLGARAMETSKAYFSPEAASEMFHGALVRGGKKEP